MSCKLADICSGCPWISTAYEEQLSKKRDAFVLAWQALGFSEQSFSIASAGALGTRDRVDLQLRSGSVLGLYESNTREVVSIVDCPAMSPQLENWFKDFKSDLPSIEKGSVRLRVAPDGTRGVWLDFANEDVKRLFEERVWLERVLQKGVVEIGQRKKRLTWNEGRPRLVDPQLQPWMTTRWNDWVAPLWMTVGSFSQPGDKVNQLLVDTVMRQVSPLPQKQWLELGAGSGNFTLPLLASGRSVIAVELDGLAVEGLKRGAEAISSDANLEIIERSFESAGALPRVGEVAILVDPPRSGLGKFLQSPIVAQAAALTYVSCWTESFMMDAVQLRQLGFRPIAAEAVDLFPGTPYAEWVVTFIREAK